MPLGVLLIFGATSANDTVPGRADVDVLTLFVPGILAFAIVVVAYGNLAATIALQRADGVLKRIRATPLDPTVYLGGQILSVLATTLLISAATIAAGGVAFGALPRADAIPQLLVVLALGIACFAALGIAISAAIPTADAAGAITNGTYLPLAMVSGMFSASLQPARHARHDHRRVSPQGPRRRPPHAPTTPPPTASPSATPRSWSSGRSPASPSHHASFAGTRSEAHRSHERRRHPLRRFRRTGPGAPLGQATLASNRRAQQLASATESAIGS